MYSLINNAFYKTCTFSPNNINISFIVNIKWQHIVQIYGVFFSTKKYGFYLKLQFCVCFLKMLRPLKG